jgi:mevalonate kinase
VGDLRSAWQANQQPYEALFERVGALVQTARRLLEAGQPHKLGPLMDENHACLQEMGVSSPQLDRLVQAARQAGAAGAKLSGGGRGGNMIALVDSGTAGQVAAALRAAGAQHTLTTQVSQAEASLER